MTRALVAVLLLVSLALAADPDDDGDLAEALDEVAAAGGLVDAADLDPWWRADGLLRCGARWRDQGAPRGDLRLELQQGAWQMGGRWRQQDPAPEGLAWGRLDVGGQTFGTGAVGYQHGFGLLSAAAGARTRLDASSTLLPRRAGWRTTLSTAAGSRLEAIWCDVGRDQARLQGALGRDLDGEPAHLVAFSLGRSGGLRGLWLRRGRQTGASASLVMGHAAWRLIAEAARWDRSGSAVAALLVWRRAGWRLEGQAAWSRASKAMPGAARPASLWGWRGHGWAIRASGRPHDLARVDVLLSVRERTDADVVRPDVTTRSRTEVALTGRRWRLRWRHDEDAVTSWLVEAPWLPPTRGVPQAVRWLAASIRHPLPAGQLLLDWRRRQDGRGARHLAAVGWRRDLGTLRVQIRGQMAWGDPVDLVSLSVPARGIYLVQHWGQWDGGLWVSVQRRAPLGWQLMLARRTPRQGLGAAAELQGQLGVTVEF